MAHPLRVGLLVTLRDGPLSAQTLAAELGAPPHEIRRHARVLETLGYLRGPQETGPRLYELVAPPKYSDEAWARLPIPARRAALAPAILGIQSLVSRAVDRGGFDGDHMHLTRTDLRLSRTAWDTIARQLNALVEDLAAQQDAEPDESAIPAHVVLMLFAAGESEETLSAPSAEPASAEDADLAAALDVHEATAALLAEPAIDWEAIVRQAESLRMVATAAARAQAATPARTGTVVPLRPRK